MMKGVATSALTFAAAGCATVAYTQPTDPVVARLAQCVASAKSYSYSVRSGSDFAVMLQSFAAHWTAQLAQRVPDPQQQSQALAWGANTAAPYRPGGGMSGLMAQGERVGRCEQEFGRPAPAGAANG